MKTIEIELIPYHSAIPSWSGYQYQGKVALNVVLDYILRIEREEYSKYLLELEWYEDFCIIREDEYVSIHQVKSYKNKNLSEYKDAIWNLLGKSIHKSCKKSFLHSTIDLGTEDEIKRELIKLKPPKKPEVPGKDYKGPKKRGYSPWHYYNMVTSKDAYDTAFEKFSKYTYSESKQYCPLLDLETEIKGRIKEYCSVNKGQVPTEAQIETTYTYLLGEIDKHITYRHSDEQENEDEEITPDKISFLDIIEVLDANWEEPSKDYVVFQLRNVFHNTCESLFVELHSAIMESEKYERLEDLERIESYVQVFAALSNDAFFNFCQMVTPHIEIPKASVDAFRCLIPSNGIEVLFSSFYEIKCILTGSKFIVKDQNDKNISYLPSTIKLSVGRIRTEANEISKIAVGILGNASIRKELFEIEVIITESILADSLEVAANKFTDIETLKTNDKITKIKNIRLIDIDTAMGELNK
ncbi:hypothetical protein CA600_27885 [Paenibacillus sp. VTT E-133280]|uniref:ABC-three component system protein n=1 Tax=Paenibacillus sp. VTT E-133280 TaxID=1986222 RepID=UPI000BA08D1A|nr:ABC-three component system protein [Paenibacillus sp. VTT E-133280]OZQ60555.1 hypothetical protein CA600_27885 [Paenibacillus sp. VTT E-133280]